MWMEIIFGARYAVHEPRLVEHGQIEIFDVDGFDGDARLSLRIIFLARVGEDIKQELRDLRANAAYAGGADQDANFEDLSRGHFEMRNFVSRLAGGEKACRIVCVSTHRSRCLCLALERGLLRIPPASETEDTSDGLVLLSCIYTLVRILVSRLDA